MDQDLTVQIHRLRGAFELIADYLQEREGNALSLGNDYFWSIPDDELYDVYHSPAKMTVGQVSESWQHIEDMLDGKANILPYHLIWLSDVLRAIAQDVDPSD